MIRMLYFGITYILSYFLDSGGAIYEVSQSSFNEIMAFDPETFVSLAVCFDMKLLRGLNWNFPHT